MIGNLIRLSLLAYAWSLVIPVIAGAAQCEVTVGFTEEVSASGIFVDVSYPTSGVFDGADDQVDCHTNVSGGLATFNNQTTDGVLRSALIRIDPFSGDDLLSCTWNGSVVSAGDFVVTTIDATSAQLETIDPFPSLVVTNVTCDGTDTTGEGDGDGATGAADGEGATGAADGGCYMVVSASSTQAIGGLMVDIHYDGTGVEVGGASDAADCVTLVEGGLGAFNDKEDEGKLTTAMIHLSGFSGYTDVFECYVDTFGEVSADDLQIVILDPVNPQGTPIVPAPEVDVRYVECDFSGGGTDPTGDDEFADEDSDEPTGEPDSDGDGECTGGAYDVTFSVEASLEFGSLQFETNYASAPGGFEGMGDAVSCEVVVPGGGHFASFNDQDGQSRVIAGIVSIGGFSTPGDVVRCRFEADGAVPTADDFSVSVTDASTPNVQTMVPVPAVVVSSVTPASDNPCGGNCGNGVVDGNEDCDDGNDSNTDGCTNECASNFCGDGFVNEGVEACDDGNGDDADACVSDCTENVCGDGAVYAGVEECDDGAANSDSAADACRSDCSFAICGDGVADAGEDCDDANDSNTDSCLNGCVAAYCGDGYVEAEAEDCDDGLLNNDADPETCRTDCTWPLICGDVDGNGLVSATDARRVLESAVGLADHCTGRLCDVDGSSLVTASDAQLVLGYAVGVDVELQCMMPVIVSLDSEHLIGALQFSIDYALTGSNFVGDGADVYCVSLIDGAMVSFNNMTDTSKLHVGVVSIAAFQGPIDLMACSFYPTGVALAAEDFQVEVTDATDELINYIALGDVEIGVRFE
jgi:cysteine-rich repeat protein